jgi:hypothetical protein
MRYPHTEGPDAEELPESPWRTLQVLALFLLAVLALLAMQIAAQRLHQTRFSVTSAR